jgi:Rrf2 family transcriptional regulator, iron-sulfur cluster assembly transcription factor
MLNKQTFIAIEVCVCIARLQHQISCSTSQLSSQLGLSVSYLELILKQLKAHEIVCSFRGPGGGYKILGATDKVSMWDIAQIFEDHSQSHHPDNDWTLARYEQGLQHVIESTLRDYTLADFASTSPLPLPLEGEGMGKSDNRFKFKPLAPAWIPKAPNSVFQLHLHS